MLYIKTRLISNFFFDKIHLDFYSSKNQGSSSKDMKLIKKIILIMLLLLPLQAQAFSRYNAVVKYDPYFSKYTKRYSV